MATLVSFVGLPNKVEENTKSIFDITDKIVYKISLSCPTLLFVMGIIFYVNFCVKSNTKSDLRTSLKNFGLRDLASSCCKLKI